MGSAVQVADDSEHAAVVVVVGGEPEQVVDVRRVLHHGFLRDRQPPGDGGVGAALGDQRDHLRLPGGQPGEGVVAVAGAGEHRGDDLGVEHRAAVGDRPAKGTLLSRTTQAERLTFKPLTGVQSPLTIGYGLGAFEIQGYIGHNGAIVGYSSAAFYRPDIDTTIAVVGNRSSNFSTPTTTVFVAIAKTLNSDLFPKG